MPSTDDPRISEPSTVCFKAVLAVSCDITSPESIEELQQRVASQFTDLRVVVCNAGVPWSTHSRARHVDVLGSVNLYVV